MTPILTASDHILLTDHPLLKLSVMDVYLSTGSRDLFLQEMVRLSDHVAQSAYICFMNVHMLIEANKNLDFRRIVNGADVICPDGLPVAMSVGWFYAIHQEQIAGPDTLPLLLDAASNTNKKVFILGSTESVVNKFRERASEEFPNADICGHACPPFRPLTAQEDEDLVELINRSGADMIFVALGCPKQERWMAAHRDRVKGCMFGLGYAIPVYAGVESRAPRWMIDHGMEWVFRLSTDPRRLFKRYVQTNSFFARRMVWPIAKWFIKLSCDRILRLRQSMKIFSNNGYELPNSGGKDS